MTSEQEKPIIHRKVSALLLIGVVLMPYIFFWFLLRAGYSIVARFLGGLWLIVVISLMFSRDNNLNDRNPPTATPSSATSSVVPPPAPTYEWLSANFVDEFGTKTGDGFLTTYPKITGKFSNSAVEDAPLSVKVLLISKDEIQFMLYEYKGNNPVKNADSAYYVVIFDSAQVKNSDLNGHNNSDRVVLDKKSSDVFFSALLKGNVEVYMVGDRGGIDSKYKFTVPGGDAFQHLSEKIHKKP